MFGYLTIMWVYYSLWHYYPMGNVMFLPYHTDVLSINTSVFTPDSISLWWRNVTNQSSAWEGLYSAQCSAESCRTYFIPAWTGRFIELAASPSLLLPLPLHIFLIRLNGQHAQRQRCVCAFDAVQDAGLYGDDYYVPAVGQTQASTGSTATTADYRTGASDFPRCKLILQSFFLVVFYTGKSTHSLD